MNYLSDSGTVKSSAIAALAADAVSGESVLRYDEGGRMTFIVNVNAAIGASGYLLLTFSTRDTADQVFPLPQGRQVKWNIFSGAAGATKKKAGQGSTDINGAVRVDIPDTLPANFQIRVSLDNPVPSRLHVTGTPREVFLKVTNKGTAVLNGSVIAVGEGQRYV
jgi:hypothetical protein